MWFYVALGSSVIGAISIILNKRILRSVSPLVLTWCTLVLATPIIAIFAIKEGMPNLNSWFAIGILGSVFFYVIHKVAQFRAMKIADLSAIYPLIALSPIFTLIIAYLPPLSERSGFIAIVGVFVTLFGTYILNVSNAKEGLLRPIKLLFENKASALMIVSALADSVVVIFDKLAINNTIPQNTNFVLLIQNVLTVLIFLPVLKLRNKNFKTEIYSNKKLFIILGVLSAISTILAFSAIGGGNVALVTTIFRSQLLFVLLFSFFFFKDKPKLETIIGSMVMILGVVLIKIGS
ncbi:MAG: DMT family transporter [bacterium]|nr:DMT family transporter [bacterium]